MASGIIQKVIPDSGTNYCKMPDGTLIQWGYSNPSYANANIALSSVTFPIAFTAQPVVSLTVGDAQNTAQELAANVKIGSITASKFDISYQDPASQFRSDGSYIKPIYWLAIGRWK